LRVRASSNRAPIRSNRPRAIEGGDGHVRVSGVTGDSRDDPFTEGDRVACTASRNRRIAVSL
jgi:hypothetical protein